MGAEKTQRSIGWYAGAAAFWLITVWLATVGLSSLIPQIFGPAGGSGRQGSSCAEDLHDLTRELLDRSGEHLKRAPKASARGTLDAFFSDFDRRLLHTKLSCAPEERAAWTELSRLRHGTAALLERFDREELPHLQKLDALLEHRGSASTP